MNDLELKAKLARKKQQVIEKVKGIEKTGTNTAQKYKYAEESEVVKQIRTTFNEVGIVFSVSAADYKVTHEIPTKYSKMANIAIILTCTLTDSETGYSESSEWLGSAADSGDKALYKAFTGGIKYFLLKTFLLPTGDDPEAFGHEEPDGKQMTKEEKPKAKSATNPPTEPKMEDHKRAFFASLDPLLKKIDPTFKSPASDVGRYAFIEEIVKRANVNESPAIKKFGMPTPNMGIDSEGWRAMHGLIAELMATPELIIAAWEEAVDRCIKKGKK